MRLWHRLYHEAHALLLTLVAHGAGVFSVYVGEGDSDTRTYIGSIVRVSARKWISHPLGTDAYDASAYVSQTRTGALGLLTWTATYRVQAVYDAWFPLAAASCAAADEPAPLPFDAQDRHDTLESRWVRVLAWRRAGRPEGVFYGDSRDAEMCGHGVPIHGPAPDFDPIDCDACDESNRISDQTGSASPILIVLLALVSLAGLAAPVLFWTALPITLMIVGLYHATLHVRPENQGPVQAPESPSSDWL